MMETARPQEAGCLHLPLAAARRGRSPSGPAVARPSIARLAGTVRRARDPAL